MKLRLNTICLVLLLALTGCGGGGDSTSNQTNNLPVANAGTDQEIAVGTTVSLDGSASTDSDDDTLSYSWSFLSLPAGSLAEILAPTTSSPSFTADVSGVYVLALTVNDVTGNSPPDSVTITSSETSSLPIANAGIDQEVEPGTIVYLSASGSYDNDQDPLTYKWSFLSRPYGSGATIVSPNSISPEFKTDFRGTYVVKLLVSDANGNVEDIVEISANPSIKTIVTGIISTDTVWTTQNSPYAVPDRVQIAEGATLTIEPGVQVYRGGTNFQGTNGHAYIEAFGNISAIGTQESPIVFYGLDILPGNSGSGVIDIQWAVMQYTATYVASLRDSIIAGAWVQPSQCSTTCAVERNIIIGGPVIVRTNVIIEDNVFYDYHVGFPSSAYAIESKFQNATIRNNSFLSIDRLAVLVDTQDIDIRDNYWGTTDTLVIESMIQDKNDDLGLSGYGTWSPPLTGPSINTPDIADRL